MDKFDAGHVAGATSVPLSKVEEKFSTIVDLIDSDSPEVVYCTNQTCDDALYLAKELMAMGLTNLSYMIDGFEAWAKAGYSIASH